MFSEIIDVKILRPSDINPVAISDINYLLKQQHRKARMVERERLLDHMKRSKIVVAWNDSRLIGMGVLVRTYCISHEFASIHNLVIREGYDPLAVGMRIVKLLIADIHDMSFVEAGVWLQNDEMVRVLEALSFVQKPKFRYRLKL